MVKKYTLYFLLAFICMILITSSVFASRVNFGSGAVGAFIESVLDLTEENSHNFERHTITIDVIGQGEVIKIPNLQNYPHKKLIKLQAVPVAGWKFSHWEGDIQENNNPASFLITENLKVTAVFTQQEYSLSITSTGGFVTINPEKESYHYGDEVTLTATAEPGWVFDHWGVAIIGEKNPASLTIYGDTSVTVFFRPNFIAIDAGRDYSLALGEDGTVWAWGNNFHGQLGDGSNIYRSNPVNVSNLNNVVPIATSGYHSFAIKNDGTVWAWGHNYYRQLGDGTNIDRSTPVNVSNLNNVVAVAGGWSHSLALKDDGTVWAWGYNRYGQLGDGTNITSTTPVNAINLNNVAAIAAGVYHSLALKEDGTVWAWGYNDSGQLGDGTSIAKQTPVQISNLNNVVAIAAGGHHSLALKEDGTVWAWGYIGQRGTVIIRPTPERVSNFNVE